MFLKHLRLFKPTIGNRIGLVMVGVLLCNVLTIGSGLHGLRQVEEQLGHLVNINTVKGDAVADMRFAVTARLDRVRNIALTSEVDDMQADQLAIDKLISEYARSTQTLQSMSLQPREAELLASITTISAEAGRLMDQAQKLARMMNPEQAAALLTKKVAPLQLRWFAALDELDAISTGERTQTLNQASDVRRTAVLEMVFVGVLSLLMGAGSAFILARSLRSRLRTSVAVTSRIAQGDLTVNVETQGRDEVAQLMTAVRDMQHRLLSTVVDIKRSTESIRLASSEIAVGNQDLSQRTEQQAARLQHTAASMQIMTDAVEASADGAQQAEALAATASEVAARGGSVVGRVVSTMGDIQASSKRIADIVGVIDGIAFQTNILALNAAVEAARAGEQGRGFAVVASEVRALAKRSADSAREIKTLIGASVENVELGAELVSDAGRTMTEIVDKVKRVGELIGQISSASSSQTSGIGKVNAAVVQLDQMTQSNAALVEQSAAASESLRAQAEQLAQAVAAFRVDDGVCT